MGHLLHVMKLGITLLFLALSGWAQTDPAVLQLRVVQGEGAVYAAGSRATRGVVVQITDETGKPVEGAIVNFRLPEQGPSGQFSSGQRNEIVNTDASGRAEVWGMQWGRETGAFELRITAAKGQVRGGVVCPLYLSAAAVLTQNRDAAPVHKISRSKKRVWIAVGLAAAIGVAAVGVTGKAPAAVPTPSAPQIGTPTIAIGRP